MRALSYVLQHCHIIPQLIYPFIFYALVPSLHFYKCPFNSIFFQEVSFIAVEDLFWIVSFLLNQLLPFLKCDSIFIIGRLSLSNNLYIFQLNVLLDHPFLIVNHWVSFGLEDSCCSLYTGSVLSDRMCCCQLEHVFNMPFPS